MSGVNRVLIKIFMKLNLPGIKVGRAKVVTNHSLSIGRLAPKTKKIIKRRTKAPVAPRMRQYGDKGYKPSTGKGVGH